MVEFRPTTLLDSLKPHTIVRIKGNGLLGTVVGPSQKYYGVYLVRVPGEEQSRLHSAEGLEILVQDKSPYPNSK